MRKKREPTPKPRGPSGVVRRMREQREHAIWHLYYELGLSFAEIAKAYRAHPSLISVSLMRERKRREEAGILQR
jgi:hypothetical protein